FVLSLSVASGAEPVIRGSAPTSTPSRGSGGRAVRTGSARDAGALTADDELPSPFEGPRGYPTKVEPRSERNRPHGVRVTPGIEAAWGERLEHLPPVDVEQAD